MRHREHRHEGHPVALEYRRIHRLQDIGAVGRRLAGDLLRACRVAQFLAEPRRLDHARAEVGVGKIAVGRLRIIGIGAEENQTLRNFRRRLAPLRPPRRNPLDHPLHFRHYGFQPCLVAGQPVMIINGGHQRAVVRQAEPRDPQAVLIDQAHVRREVGARLVMKAILVIGNDLVRCRVSIEILVESCSIGSPEIPVVLPVDIHEIVGEPRAIGVVHSLFRNIDSHPARQQFLPSLRLLRQFPIKFNVMHISQILSPPPLRNTCNRHPKFALFPRPERPLPAPPARRRRRLLHSAGYPDIARNAPRIPHLQPAVSHQRLRRAPPFRMPERHLLEFHAVDRPVISYYDRLPAIQQPLFRAPHFKAEPPPRLPGFPIEHRRSRVHRVARQHAAKLDRPVMTDPEVVGMLLDADQFARHQHRRIILRDRFKTRLAPAGAFLDSDPILERLRDDPLLQRRQAPALRRQLRYSNRADRRPLDIPCRRLPLLACKRGRIGASVSYN